MPFIDVRIFEERLTPESEERLIGALTDAVASVLGEPAREQTWVVLTGAPAARWGVAGKRGRAPEVPQ
ncbi:4-oxalocrotonate tautomerase [Thermocatellispora tengchongensis]|uniref:4-oxalocrotonate tautomerase n=1 Tax=Thermocatellispora tengchongensis TaxID=1073253 RepID=A0A840P2E8_9ACTN|nr:tautomerase family protein [Thermocatellispora tengchongensis]MBB5135454.1 4-oxalocrotonate tautomerase [Thermocatellispora tengchongensis]